MKTWQIKTLLTLSLFGSATFAFSNVVGSAYQIFNPSYNPDSFVTVEKAQTMKSGQFTLGIWGDYASNSLPYVSADGEDTSKSESKLDSLCSGAVSLGLGITDNWDVGVIVPLIFSVDIDGDHVVENEDELKDATATEIRVASKLQLMGEEDSGVALIGRLNFDRIEDNVFTGSDPDLGYSVEMAVSSGLTEKVDVAVNAGYRWNSQGDEITGAQYKELSNSVVMSGALGVKPSDRFKISLELYRAQPTDEKDHATDRDQSPFEGLIGLRWMPNRVLAVNAGYAREIQHSLGSADWRAFGGITLSLGGTPKTVPVIIPKPMPLPTPEPTPVSAPQVVVPPPPPAQVVVVKNIKFATGSANLSSDAATKAALAAIVEDLKTDFTKVEIGGYSDSVGSDAANLKLSQKRADAIREKIISLGGLDGTKITAVGYGEANPIDTNDTPEGRANNRRVEFKIIRG